MYEAFSLIQKWRLEIAGGSTERSAVGYGFSLVCLVNQANLYIHDGNFIFRAVCHTTLKCRVCLLEAVTLISIASGSQCLNDVPYSLPLLLLTHNEVKTLSVLLMYITGWNVIFLQLSGTYSFS